METKRFRPEQIRALQCVRNAGEAGYNTMPHGPLAPFALTLAILSRSQPELLTGFTKDEDPAGSRVTLTDRGVAELAMLDSE